MSHGDQITCRNCGTQQSVEMVYDLFPFRPSHYVCSNCKYIGSNFEWEFVEPKALPLEAYQPKTVQDHD